MYNNKAVMLPDCRLHRLLDYSASLLVSVPRNPNGPKMKGARPAHETQTSSLKKEQITDDLNETPQGYFITLHQNFTH